MKVQKFIITAVYIVSIVTGQMSNVLADDFVPSDDSQNSSNQFVLDADNTGGNIVLQFGATLAESLTWNSTSSLFDLSDDLTLAGGLTTSGGANSLNNNSNFTTDINTGTSTGAVSIGGGSGTVTVNSTSWDISSSGVASGLTGLTSTGAISLGNNTGTIAFDGTNFDLTTAGAVTLTGNLALSDDAGEGISGGGLTDCDNANNELRWDSSTNKFSCITDAKDAGYFIDSNPATMSDSDNVELFNDATKPNIVTNFATSKVLVSVVVNGTAGGSDNETDGVRIVYTTNGTNPSCSTSPQAGPIISGSFTTNYSDMWGATGTFIHSPGVAGTIKYTVCTSTYSVGSGVNNIPYEVSVSLTEIGS